MFYVQCEQKTVHYPKCGLMRQVSTLSVLRWQNFKFVNFLHDGLSSGDIKLEREKDWFLSGLHKYAP